MTFICIIYNIIYKPTLSRLRGHQNQQGLPECGQALVFGQCQRLALRSQVCIHIAAASSSPWAQGCLSPILAGCLPSGSCCLAVDVGELLQLCHVYDRLYFFFPPLKIARNTEPRGDAVNLNFFLLPIIFKSWNVTVFRLWIRGNCVYCLMCFRNPCYFSSLNTRKQACNASLKGACRGALWGS